ncbi:MAG: IclR family transcriptional regulator [Deltaproteobacteria bacterium]
MPTEKRSRPNRPDYSSLVPAVEQSARILLALAQDVSGKMTLTEICGTVGIHKSKGYSILNTLQHFGFVQRSPDTKIYSLGTGLLFLSNKVLSNLDIREAVAPLLHELSVQTGSTAFLGLISGDHVFVVAKDEGVQDIGVTIRLGHRFPLSWGAHGTCIVAFLPQAEQERVLSGPKLYFHGLVFTRWPPRCLAQVASSLDRWRSLAPFAQRSQRGTAPGSLMLHGGFPM